MKSDVGVRARLANSCDITISWPLLELELEIGRRKLSQGKAAKLLGITRPSLNRLLNGHLDGISIDKLVAMHTRLSRTVSVQSTRKRKAA